MPLFVSGLSHRNAPVELREQLAVDEDKLRELLRDIAATGVVREAILLSTCNRVEMYAVADVPGEARVTMFRRLCRHRGVESASVEEALYTYADSDAVRDAFALAQSCEAVGPALHSLFTQAFAVAKKVRTETEIARHAVSVSFAAVELAKKIFGGLQGKAVLLVGAGKMSELAARHLVEQGVFPVYVTNRTWARAQEMARALAAVDIVISSTGAAEPVIRRETVQRVMHGRRGRPLFFIDIAVPRDVEGSVDTLDDVYCYDIDDLKQVVDANIRERGREAHRAEALVEREVAKFLAKQGDVEVIPTIVSLRERLEAIRTGEGK